MNRNTELQQTISSLLSRDFTKIAQMGGAPMMDPAMMGGAPPMGGAPMMDPAMMGGAPPMDPAMMAPPPEMMPPEMMPPVDPAAAPAPPADESAKGMKEVAMKALDMAQDTINAIMGAQNISPDQMTDLAAATMSGTGGLQDIPPEEIAALAQQPQ